MAIDLNSEVHGSFHRKWISAGQLSQILRELQPGDVVQPNAVGNLAIGRDGECVGFIDIANEVFEPA